MIKNGVIGGYVINSEFTEDLYELGESLGYGTSTTSVAIHYTVKKYLENEDVDASHTSLYSPIANNITIGNKIKTTVGGLKDTLKTGWKNMSGKNKLIAGIGLATLGVAGLIWGEGKHNAGKIDQKYEDRAKFL